MPVVAVPAGERLVLALHLKLAVEEVPVVPVKRLSQRPIWPKLGAVPKNVLVHCNGYPSKAANLRTL